MTTEVYQTATQSRRPALAYYKPNNKFTGAAVKFRLDPARHNGEYTIPGGLAASFARQTGNGFLGFDWAHAIDIRLNINDLAQMIGVFRGMYESIADGCGLLHRSEHYNTTVRFVHQIYPVPGYALEVIRKSLDTGDEMHVQIVFTPAEALGLSIAIEQGLPLIAFGQPEI